MLVSDTRQVMGMPVTIAVIGKAQTVIDSAFARLHAIDAAYSTYKADSLVSRLNRGELLPADYPLELSLILQEAERFKHRTTGYFDIKQPDGSIDPSGIVKGWAIAQVAQLIQHSGFDNYFVDAGGDVQTAGVNQDGQPWRVGIRHPREAHKYAKLLDLSDVAVATSGTYERGQHIYNPKTGQPVSDIVSLSVVGPNIYEADLHATAAFAMGRQALEYLSRQPGYEGYLIDSHDQVSFTPGFTQYLTLVAK